MEKQAGTKYSGNGTLNTVRKTGPPSTILSGSAASSSPGRSVRLTSIPCFWRTTARRSWSSARISTVVSNQGSVTAITFGWPWPLTRWSGPPSTLWPLESSDSSGKRSPLAVKAADRPSDSIPAPDSAREWNSGAGGFWGVDLGAPFPVGHAAQTEARSARCARSLLLGFRCRRISSAICSSRHNSARAARPRSLTELDSEGLLPSFANWCQRPAAFL